MRIALSFLGVLVVAALAGGLAGSVQPKPQTKAPKPAEKPAKESKPATHKVEKGPFKIELSLKGTFEGEDMTEVRLSPKAWIPALGAAPMTVLTAVEHGTPVKKGDVLVEIDLERIDQMIKDLKSEAAIAQAAIQQTEKELPDPREGLALGPGDRRAEQADRRRGPGSVPQGRSRACGRIGQANGGNGGLLPRIVARRA